MSRTSRGTRRTHWLALGAIGSLLVSGASPWAYAEEPAVPAMSGSASVAAPAMLIYRDPVTGKFGTPPPEAQPSLPSARRAPASALRETAGTTSAGGVKVDLQGQFQSSMRVTIGPDGKRHAECGGD